MTAAVALALACALHAGFQATVTAVVYPALADLPATTWERAHRAHGTRITPLVVVVYGALVLAVAARLTAPLDAATVVALAGLAVAVGSTALAAAPTHGRLGRGRSETELALLLRADRLRLGGAVVAALAAVVPLLGGAA